MPKGYAHLAGTESIECLEPRNQGDTIGHPIREIWGELTLIHLHMFNQYHYFKMRNKKGQILTQFMHRNLYEITTSQKQID